MHFLAAVADATSPLSLSPSKQHAMMHFLGRVEIDDSMTAADAVYLSDDLAMRRAFDCVCVAHLDIHGIRRFMPLNGELRWISFLKLFPQMKFNSGIFLTASLLDPPLISRQRCHS